MDNSANSHQITDPNNDPALHADVATANSSGTTPTRGRPSLYSPDLVDSICEVISAMGFSDSAAARAVAVDPATLSRWKRIYPPLQLELDHARAKFRVNLLKIILASAQAPRGWRAAGWLLEHQFPEEYALKASERYAHRDRLAHEEMQQSAELSRFARQAELETQLEEPAPAEEVPLQIPSEPALQNVQKVPESTIGATPISDADPTPTAPARLLERSEAKSKDLQLPSGTRRLPQDPSPSTAPNPPSASQSTPPPEPPLQNLQKAPAEPAASPTPTPPPTRHETCRARARRIHREQHAMRRAERRARQAAKKS